MSLIQVIRSLRIHKISPTLCCDIFSVSLSIAHCIAMGKDFQLPWEAYDEIIFINLFTLSTTLLLPEFLHMCSLRLTANKLNE